jgi:hypothetical protein
MICSTVRTLAATVILLTIAGAATASERLSSDALLDITATAAASEAIGRDDKAYRVVQDVEGQLRAVNARAGLDAHFNPWGAGIVAGAATAELSIESIGRGENLRAVGAAQLTSSDNRVELRRDGLVEWYVNGPAGFQHGFTLHERPAPTDDGALVVGLGVHGDYSVSVNASTDAATLTSERGPRLRYAGLVAYDADGRELPARMEASTSGLRLVVDDAGAAYPIVVDPFIQSDEVFPATGDAYYFGWSVAVEGDTMVVGAWFGDIDYPGDCENGMAYVFERSGSPIWRLSARLQSSRPDPFCWGEDFGSAVAISGDWIAVGSPSEPWLLPGAELPPEVQDKNEASPYFNPSQGSVYLFRRPAGGWADATETQVLTEFDGTGYINDYQDSFGESVALEGTTLVVGAPFHDGATSLEVVNAGAAFIYENPIDAGWERTARLVPSDPFPTEKFGAKVAISGNTVVVGNLMTRAGWGASRITSAYLYEEPLDGWWNVGFETARLTAEGITDYAVAIDGSTIVVGAPFQDRAFVFVEPPGGWTHQLPNVELVPSAFSDGSGFEAFGFAVAIDGDMVAVAKLNNEDERGAVYLYRRPQSGWGIPDDPAEPIVIEPLHRLQHGNPEDFFSYSTDIDDGTVVVGAPFRWHWNVVEQRTEFYAGSVFAFTDATDTTPPTAAIARNPTAPSGGFGWDIAPVGITVTAEDDPSGSGVAEVRCAVDPPLFPTIFAELPDAPCPYLNGAAISANGEHWVYAASVDAEGNRSAVEELAVRIDTVAPAPLITLNPPTPDGPDGVYTVPVYVLFGRPRHALRFRSAGPTRHVRGSAHDLVRQ